MTWHMDAPQGSEARKVRFDVVQYCASGIDVGCGPAKVWPGMIGVDSLKDTELFGIPMKPDIVVPDAARLGLFGSEVMECVFSSHLLEHIADYKAALAEWWRLVRPGGYLVLYLPHRDFYPNIGEPGANPDHVHDFAPTDIVDAMRELAPDWDLLENQDRNGGLEYSFLQVYQKTAPGTGQRYTCEAPKPAKTAAIVRVGGHGDALWASSPAALLKEQGYHVTIYTTAGGADVLRHDPNIDRVVALPSSAMTDEDLLEYWGHLGRQYDRFVNLIGSVEQSLLLHDTEIGFYRPHALRHKLCNTNYLERVHDFAEVAYDFRQKFYPTPAELEWARKMRAELKGPLVVIAPAGSGQVKYWPHAQSLMQSLGHHGIYSVVLGDVRDPKLVGVEPWGSVIGMDWPIRLALTFATLADAVVGTESLIVNAVAFEPMLKIVTMSHSSAENLTKHWTNTAAAEPVGVACHPCHRIHGSFNFCAQDKGTGAAACQAFITADMVLGALLNHLNFEKAEAA